MNPGYLVKDRKIKRWKFHHWGWAPDVALPPSIELACRCQCKPVTDYVHKEVDFKSNVFYRVRMDCFYFRMKKWEDRWQKVPVYMGTCEGCHWTYWSTPDLEAVVSNASDFDMAWMTFITLGAEVTYGHEGHEMVLMANGIPLRFDREGKFIEYEKAI